MAWPRNGAFSRVFAGALFLPVASAAAPFGSPGDNSEILGSLGGRIQVPCA